MTTDPLRDDPKKAPESARSSHSTPDTAEVQEPRYCLYRLCACFDCAETGKIRDDDAPMGWKKCPECRGEGKVKERVVEADTPEGVGVALVTVAREGAWEGCQFGLLDRQGEVGLKWLVLPWPETARTVSEAGRLLQSARPKGEK